MSGFLFRRRSDKILSALPSEQSNHLGKSDLWSDTIWTEAAKTNPGKASKFEKKLSAKRETAFWSACMISLVQSLRSDWKTSGPYQVNIRGGFRVANSRKYCNLTHSRNEFGFPIKYTIYSGWCSGNVTKLWTRKSQETASFSWHSILCYG